MELPTQSDCLENQDHGTIAQAMKKANGEQANGEQRLTHPEFE